jgi:hypothetical protein
LLEEIPVEHFLAEFGGFFFNKGLVQGGIEFVFSLAVPDKEDFSKDAIETPIFL